jgi:hypothetical protein
MKYIFCLNHSSVIMQVVNDKYPMLEEINDIDEKQFEETILTIGFEYS